MARREVTGRKPEADPAPMPRLAFSIQEFCEAAGISESMFYKLQRERLGPRVTKIGTRSLITIEDAEQCMRERRAACAGTGANTTTYSAPPALPAPVLLPPRKVHRRRKSARAAQRQNASA